MNALSLAALSFGVLCGLAPIAQALRIRVKRSADDVSLVWLVLYGCGAAVWLGYGAVEGSVPLLASQAIALVSVTVTFVLAVKARRRTSRRYTPSVAGQRHHARGPRLSQEALRQMRRARQRLEHVNGPATRH